MPQSERSGWYRQLWTWKPADAEDDRAHSLKGRKVLASLLKLFEKAISGELILNVNKIISY